MKRRDWLKALGFGSVAAGLTGKAEAKKPKEKTALMNAEVISSMVPQKNGRLSSDEIIGFLYSTSGNEYLGVDVSWVMHSDVLRRVQTLKDGDGYHIYEGPPAIIKHPGKITPRQMDRLIKGWNKLNQGKRVKQRIIVVEEGTKFQNFPNKPSLLGFAVLADNSMSKEIKTDRPVMKLVRVAGTNSRESST